MSKPVELVLASIIVKTAFREILLPHHRLTGRDGVEQFLRRSFQLLDDGVAWILSCRISPSSEQTGERGKDGDYSAP